MMALHHREEQVHQHRMQSPNREQRPRYNLNTASSSSTSSSSSFHSFLLLSLTVIALTATGYASWACSFFETAAGSNDDDIEQPLLSGPYGLWTLTAAASQSHSPTPTNSHYCQLWYVTFVGAQLDTPFQWAQACAMASQVVGLWVTVRLLERGQRRGYGVGGGLVGLAVTSILSTSGRFNLWTVFFCGTYCVLWILVVGDGGSSGNATATSTSTTTPASASGPTTATTLTSTPPPISSSTSSNTTSSTHTTTTSKHRELALAAGGTGLVAWSTLILVRQSAFCQCAHITVRGQGQALGFGECNSQCTLGRAGWVMLGSGCLWMGVAFVLAVWGVWEEGGPEKSTTTTTREGHDEYDARFLENGSELVAYDSNRGRDTDTTTRSTRTSPDVTNTGNNDDLDPTYPSTTSIFRKLQRILYRCCVCLFIFLYLLMVLLLVLSHMQNNQAARQPDTVANFVTDTVCGFQPNPQEQHQHSHFVTFSSKAEAHAAGYTVAHCGACGHCSNPADIQTYVQTRHTIADTAKTCGKYTVLSSHDGLHTCLHDKIGLTPECTDCWVENMKTTAKWCMATCVSTLLNGFMSDNNISSNSDASSMMKGWMNQCFFCDEKQSGPAFVACSGVARRRLGIESEIVRDPREQCTAVDWDWTTVEMAELFGGGTTNEEDGALLVLDAAGGSSAGDILNMVTGDDGGDV